MAMRSMADGDFKLVLMDDLMPGISGLQALEMMRNSTQSKLKQMAVIMCTANNQPEDRQRYLMAGSNGYLSKPVSTQALQAEIEQIRLAAHSI
jgi:CheY-like chemotaxis protein